MASTHVNKTVLVAGIDTIRPKNLHQFEELGRRGYEYIILTNDYLGDSLGIAGKAPGIRDIVVSYGWKGMGMVASFLWLLLTRKIDIVEIYPYSFPAFAMTLLARLFGKPVLVIARGEEVWFLEGRMNPMTAFLFKKTYELTTHILYKELYFEDFLKIIGPKNARLISNAVTMPEKSGNHTNDNKRTFLYLNSMKHFRHPEVALEAFLEICRERGLTEQSATRLIIAGFSADKGSTDMMDKETLLKKMRPKGVPVDFVPWTHETKHLLEQADVFLLPADIVYLNFSLLEAMSLGIAPIIQRAPGAERIITNGQDGLIAPLTTKDWKHCMERFLDEPDLAHRLGGNARGTVRDNFSLEAYGKKYNDIYSSMLDR